MAHDNFMTDALSREELDDLKPDPAKMVENTYRSALWYEEAVTTAAAIFVQAAEENRAFREDFLEGSWRETMKEETPELHERVMEIGLSSFQGGWAEKMARRHLTEMKP